MTQITSYEDTNGVAFAGMINSGYYISNGSTAPIIGYFTPKVPMQLNSIVFDGSVSGSSGQTNYIYIRDSNSATIASAAIPFPGNTSEQTITVNFGNVHLNVGEQYNIYIPYFGTPPYVNVAYDGPGTSTLVTNDPYATWSGPTIVNGVCRVGFTATLEGPSAPTVTSPASGTVVNTNYTTFWNASSDNTKTVLGIATPNTAPATGYNTLQNMTGSPAVQTQAFQVPSSGPNILSSVVAWFSAYSPPQTETLVCKVFACDASYNPTTLIASVTATFSSSDSNYYQITFNFNNIQLTNGTYYQIGVGIDKSSTNGDSINVAVQGNVPYGVGANTQKSLDPNNANASGGTGYTYTSVNLITPASKLQYQLDYSRDGGSTWTNMVNLTSAGATSYAYDFTNVAASANCFIRVRAYDGVSYGDYGQSAKFTIQHNQPPNAPSFFNISSLGSTINTKPKVFSTVSDPDAGNTIQNMEIQVSTVNTFATTVLDVQYGNDSGYGTQQAAAWSGLPTTTNSNSNVTFTPQSALPVGTLYVRMRAKDNNAAWGVWSAVQQFTVAAPPWTDTLTAGNPGIKAQWLNDLATVINNARQFRGLATFAFTDGTLSAPDANGNGGNDAKTSYITERRQKLIDVLNVVGVAWNPAAIDNTKDRDQQFIIDLRNYAASA